MNYQFDIEIAEKYGVEEAIIYQNIEFWCMKNNANKSNIHNGYSWTYNSLNAWCELFPFWNRQKIFRILKKMEESSMIEKGHFSSNPFDRTTFYRPLLKDAYNKSVTSTYNDNVTSDITDMGNDYKGTDINTDINTVKKQAELDFEIFWDHWPRKVKKKPAKDKFILLYKKGQLPEIKELVGTIEAWNNTDKWKGGFIPHPTTWLKDEGWEDELPQNKVASGHGYTGGGTINYDWKD